ncbi:hypothetical protein PROFUN_02989 [Planoprotostelium fungivorum]|uniref:EGF-like domain-containing protein n=1 Tax=Planoprotostelium fungivorum TaxID=1890364 RepID=A0A2P6NXF0_9EUKA|nr:hypothetical protein PROFUN_02989 [Planoprotostelium fungivorum]
MIQMRLRNTDRPHIPPHYYNRCYRTSCIQSDSLKACLRRVHGLSSSITISARNRTTQRNVYIRVESINSPIQNALTDANERAHPFVLFLLSPHTHFEREQNVAACQPRLRTMNFRKMFVTERLKGGGTAQRNLTEPVTFAMRYPHYMYALLLLFTIHAIYGKPSSCITRCKEPTVEKFEFCVVSRNETLENKRCSGTDTLAFCLHYLDQELILSGPCGCPSNCSNRNGRGVCEDGRCKCATGWTGDDCSIVDCSTGNPCLNGGECRSFRDDSFCVCQPGFTLPDCSGQSLKLPAITQVVEHEQYSGWDLYKDDHPLYNESTVMQFHIKMKIEDEEKLLRGTGRDPSLFPLKELTIYNGDTVHTLFEAEISSIGQNTRHMNKKSMKIELKSPFHQQRKFVLKSSVVDPSFLKEKLSTATLRSLGVPVPRASYSLLYINGKSRGLHILLENDHKEFMYSRFSEGGGSRCDSSWVCKPKEDQALISLLGLLHNKTSIDDWQAKIEKQFNISMYIRALVAEIVTSNWDGFWNRNNFVTYQHPTTKVFHTFRTDLDIAFGFSYGRSTDFTSFLAGKWADRSGPFSELRRVPQWKTEFETTLENTLKVWFFPAGPIEEYARELHRYVALAAAEDHYFQLDSGWSLEQVGETLERFPLHTHAPGIIPFIQQRQKILSTTIHQ